MNPRAAINGLLPFQGSPFNRLGTSPSIKRLNFPSLFIEKSAEREGFEPSRPFGQTVDIILNQTSDVNTFFDKNCIKINTILYIL